MIGKINSEKVLILTPEYEHEVVALKAWEEMWGPTSTEPGIDPSGIIIQPLFKRNCDTGGYGN